MSLLANVRRASPALLLVAALPFAACSSSSDGANEGDTALAQGPVVQVTPDTANRRVEVTVDGQPFTSYIWPTTIKKPVLYPIRTASGLEITRAWPVVRAGGRVDHPHHVGLWFNHSNVNGLDFWNNSDSIPASRADRMGSIIQTSIDSMASGPGQGVLDVTTTWIKPDSTPLIRENTRYVFHAGPNLRSIDRITTLTALDTAVTFGDNKDGALGLRVRRELEQPTGGSEKLSDGAGGFTEVADITNPDVTGHYRSADGVTGDSVWSSRSRWTDLSGVVDGEPVTIAIFDYPTNYNFPTYWHARGYGLYAANPFGAKDFTDGKVVDDFTLDAGQSMTLRYRVLILNSPTTPDQIEADYQEWAAQ